MGDRQNGAVDLLEQVYAAVDGELDWHVLLDTLRQCVNADMAAMFCWDKQADCLAWMWQVGHSAHSIALYQQYYIALDLMLHRVRTQPTLHWEVCQQLISDAFIRRSEYYQDFLIPNHIRYIAGCNLLNDATVQVAIGFQRAPDRSPFLPETMLALSAVEQHLARAIRLYLQLQRYQQRHSQLLQMLESFGHAVLVVAENGALLFANPAGEALLHSGTGWRMCCDHIALSDPDLDARWRRGVSGAIRQRQSCRLVAGDGVGHMTEGVIEVQPCHITGYPPCALVLVGAPSSPTSTTASVRIVEFGLSPAEQRVATAIAHGQTPSDYAVQQGVSLATVRTQLRNIFRKTGCQRQADLVRLFGMAGD